jgi:MFS family permease
MSTPKIFNRDFVLVFLSQFAVASVFTIYVPTIPIYLSRRGCSEVEIGALIGIQGLSSLVLRPFVGRALSAVSEKTFMIGGALLFALTAAAYLVAPPFWPFLVVRIFQGVGLALFYTAAFTLVARISPDAHRGQSMGYYLLSINIAFAVAPVFGMFLINNYGYPLLFLICTSVSCCSLVFSSRIEVPKTDAPDAPSMQGESFFNWQALPPSIMIFLTHILWGTVMAFFPLYSIKNGVGNPGFFFAIYAVILILGRGLGGKLLDRYSRDKVILPCLTTYIVAMILLAFSRTFPMFVLVALIWGSGNAFFIPSLLALTVDLAGASRGPAMGLYTALGDLGMGIGPVIMGIVLRFSDYPVMFLCLGLTALINLVYFYFFVRDKAKTVLAHAVAENR